MTKIWLSKSTYLRSLQCRKSLFLYKNFYQLRDKPTTDQLLRFEHGHQVGSLAQRLFPGGIDLKPASPKQWNKVIETTRQLIRNKQPIIYEAAFQYDGVMCAVDVLELTTNGWRINEVKSSTKYKDVFLEDMAVQYWIVSGNDVTVTDVRLIQPNPKSEDLISLNDFVLRSFLKEVTAMQGSVTQNVHKAKKILGYEMIPNITMSEHCNVPYTCDFKGFCFKQRKHY